MIGIGKRACFQYLLRSTHYTSHSPPNPTHYITQSITRHPLHYPVPLTILPSAINYITQCYPLHYPVPPNTLPSATHYITQCHPLHYPVPPTTLPSATHYITQCHPLHYPVPPTTLPSATHYITQCHPPHYQLYHTDVIPSPVSCGNFLVS